MLSALGNPRQAAAQVLNFALVLSTAFMVRCTQSSLGLRWLRVADLAVDVERSFRHQRFPFTDRRRPLRVNGARLPAR